MAWRQARWREPLVHEYPGHRCGFLIPYSHEDETLERLVGAPEEKLGKMLRREISLPGLSEVEVVRHFVRLAQMSYGVDVGPTPLGSCTMKFNPPVNEKLVALSGIQFLHPYQDEDTVQGLLEVLYKLERWLAELTGMDRCSLLPPAGAAGELAGALMIKKYHVDRGESQRDEMLVPDSAHGTNPASAAMAGFRVIRIPTSEKGTIDLNALKAVVGERTAGLMLTNPNTLGVFEEDILEIADIVHEAGGLLYYDGANLNAIMGIVRPGDMGFNIVHLNLHKTFSTPHGGGGPGAGPVCAKGELVDYLPRPLIAYDGRKYYWDYECKKCIGRIRAYYGNIIPLVKAFLYIASMGLDGLREAAIQSVINTNYFIALMRDSKGFQLPHDPQRPRKHELVLSAEPLKRETGITADDVAKNLLDRGLHAPITYFPLVVEEALMIEFTESETKENIEEYARALLEIERKARENPQELKKAPMNTSVRRVDQVYANHPRHVTPSYRVLKRRERGEIVSL